MHCLLATRQRVARIEYAQLICFFIAFQLICNIFLYRFCIFPYRVYVIFFAPKFAVSVCKFHIYDHSFLRKAQNGLKRKCGSQVIYFFVVLLYNVCGTADTLHNTTRWVGAAVFRRLYIYVCRIALSSTNKCEFQSTETYLCNDATRSCLRDSVNVGCLYFYIRRFFFGSQNRLPYLLRYGRSQIFRCRLYRFHRFLRRYVLQVPSLFHVH